MVEQVSYKKIV